MKTMTRKPTVAVRLTPQEIRHIVSLIEAHEQGRYDCTSRKWTYPQLIVRKLKKVIHRLWLQGR